MTNINYLENMTLQSILEFLVDHYGWELLGEKIRIKCFTANPSIASSLTFLRRTPWARAKVESLYMYVKRNNKKKHNN